MKVHHHPIYLSKGPRQKAKARVDGFQRRQFAIAGFGVRIGVADDRRDARQDEELIGITSIALGARLDIGAIGLPIRLDRRVGENDLGMARGKAAAVVRCACLEDDGLALRRPLDIERAPHLERLGPVPKNVRAAISELAADDKIAVREAEVPGGYVMRHFFGTKEADVEALSEQDRKILDAFKNVICDNFSSNEISDATHDRV